MDLEELQFENFNQDISHVIYLGQLCLLKTASEKTEEKLLKRKQVQSPKVNYCILLFLTQCIYWEPYKEND